MSSFSSTLGLTTFFVLVSFLLVSGDSEFCKAVVIDKDYNLTGADFARLTTPSINGDLAVGARMPGDSLSTVQMNVTNPSSSIYSTNCHWGFSPSHTITWMSIINEPGSDAVFCDASQNIGDRLVFFSVRVNPKSTAVFNLWVATVTDPWGPPKDSGLV